MTLSTDIEIYIVQGASGLVFTATHDIVEAKRIYDFVGEGAKVVHWKNNKCIYTSPIKQNRSDKLW